jgi:hypothetical protein
MALWLIQKTGSVRIDPSFVCPTATRRGHCASLALRLAWSKDARPLS